MYESANRKYLSYRVKSQQMENVGAIGLKSLFSMWSEDGLGGSASARLLVPPLRPAHLSFVGGQKEDWNCI